MEINHIRLESEMEEMPSNEADRIDVAITSNNNNCLIMIPRGQLIDADEVSITVKDVKTDIVHCFGVDTINYLAFLFLKFDNHTKTLKEFYELEICKESSALIPYAVVFISEEIEKGIISKSTLTANFNKDIIIDKSNKRRVKFDGKASPSIIHSFNPNIGNLNSYPIFPYAIRNFLERKEEINKKKFMYNKSPEI